MLGSSKAMEPLSYDRERACIFTSLEDRIMGQRQTCDRAQLKMLLAQQLLEQVEHQLQSAFAELHLLETSVRSLQKRLALVDAGTSSFDLI